MAPTLRSSRLKLHYGDLTDTSNFTRLIRDIEPDEIYNLGAQSHVAVSFEAPEYTADVGCLAQMGWSAGIQLERGLADTYQWYLANIETVWA